MADIEHESCTMRDPWNLSTPPGTSQFQMYRDDTVDPPLGWP